MKTLLLSLCLLMGASCSRESAHEFSVDVEANLMLKYIDLCNDSQDDEISVHLDSSELEEAVFALAAVREVNLLGPDEFGKSCDRRISFGQPFWNKEGNIGLPVIHESSGEAPRNREVVFTPGMEYSGHFIVRGEDGAGDTFYVWGNASP